MKRLNWRWLGKAAGVAGAALMLALALTSGTAIARSESQWVNTPKQALAFYYGWYGNPEVSGSWHHWKNVDVQKKHIDESTHYPALGPYDSHDPKVVDTHCRQAKNAGLTGFIVSWWAKGDFHDKGIPLMLDTAQKYGLKVTVYYETVPPRGNPTVDGAVGDLIYIMNSYARHPAWLKVKGKPVIFLYGRAVGELKLEGWQQVIDRFTAKYPGGAVFIGDEISPEAARIFDGIHTYNPTGLTKGKSLEEIRTWARATFPDWVKTAGPGRIACVTIIPGYDDSVQPSRKPPRPITERYNGETYKVMWEEAIAANPDWVIVTSWNEWHEGSEIEPSAELGNQDLETTRRFTRKFLSLKPRSTT
ncbi:MAG TPA: glycoside hydrolase family 99-like domain-containing protein [Bryobacteraceae bacterium]|nr:glycoside hydrolase family 99-like domain-containing protein [Bryobacteraceae bacterium]